MANEAMRNAVENLKICFTNENYISNQVDIFEFLYTNKVD